MRKSIKQFVLLSVILFALYSCKKSNTHENLAKFKTNTVATITGVSVVNGVPHYDSVEIFHEIYDALSSDYQTNLDAVGNTEFTSVTGDSLTDEQYDNGLNFDILDFVDNPLLTFENSVGFTSLRTHHKGLILSWLSGQNGDSLDNSTYPRKFSLGPIMESMINQDGNFNVGSKAYHVESDMTVFEFNGVGADSLRDYITENYSALKGGNGLANWVDNLDDKVQMNANYSEAEQQEEGCYHNRSSRWNSWIAVDGRNRYTVWHTFYNDIIKTTAGVEIDAYYRIAGGTWVPAVTKIHIGYQLHVRNVNCVDKVNSEDDGPHKITGPKNWLQTNWWSVRKQVKEANWNNEGFFGKSKVKNTGGSWTVTYLEFP